MAVAQPLTANERRDWLRLIRTEHIGPATFRQLLKRYGSAAKAIQALPAIPVRKKQLTLPPVEQIEAELEYAASLGATYIASCEPDYPLPLKAISDAPPLICVMGDKSLLQRHSVAIVGARNASAVGRKIASTLAEALGQAELVVTSGLARGIDGAAHQAALHKGTIAVVAGGVDIIYPPEHAELTNEIARYGAIVSEMPPGYQPKGRDFPRRNRIISGLSLGVIVVEAAAKSGTLITARFALEQGREVFAVPGSPLDPRCQGTNGLIRQGATLIETAEDVLDALQGVGKSLGERENDLFAGLEQEEDTHSFTQEEFVRAQEELKSLLSFTPVHKDMLLRESDMPPALLADALLEMVLSGEAEEHLGGKFSLAP